MSERFQHRLLALSAILIALALLLLGQLMRWQIQNHVLWDQRARVQIQPSEIPPHGGLILDRSGHILAMDAFAYGITGDPRSVTDLEKTVVELEPWLPQSREKLSEILGEDRPYVVVATDLSPEAAEAVEGLDLDGIHIDPQVYRFYPEGPLAGHLLGFVNADRRGFGLEKYYHEHLRGQPGQRCAVWDSLDLLRDVPAKDGADVYLALDYLLQHEVEQELARAVEEAGAEGGTTIVMDPRKGAVLAWASYPGYDPNQFPELASTAPELFLDAAISKQYEPGSVVKILTMAAALDSGLVTSQSVMEDREAIEVGGRVIRNWDGKGHGLVSLVDVLALSLNVCSAQLSTRMGSQTFYHYLSAFGLGQKTEVDLTGEIAGRVKQPGDADWSESELGMNSFGQGIAITPLQLVAAVAAVANGGHLMRPYVAEGWMQEGELESNEPKSVRQAISSETARQLTEMLVQVVQREAPEALVPGYRVAGKTGTAQIPIPGGYHPQDTIASFVGYLPAEAPTITILVKIDRPQSSPWGRDVAAPVFSRIAETACHLLDIPSPGAQAWRSPTVADR
jgi:cell division protein FtsI (penicillin-binding protein 3)